MADVISVSRQRNKDLWSDGHERQNNDVLHIGQYFARGLWGEEGGDVVDGGSLDW